MTNLTNSLTLLNFSTTFVQSDQCQKVTFLNISWEINQEMQKITFHWNAEWSFKFSSKGIGSGVRHSKASRSSVAYFVRWVSFRIPCSRCISRVSIFTIEVRRGILSLCCRAAYNDLGTKELPYHHACRCIAAEWIAPPSMGNEISGQG